MCKSRSLCDESFAPFLLASGLPPAAISVLLADPPLPDPLVAVDDRVETSDSLEPEAEVEDGDRSSSLDSTVFQVRVEVALFLRRLWS